MRQRTRKIYEPGVFALTVVTLMAGALVLAGCGGGTDTTSTTSTTGTTATTGTSTTATSGLRKIPTPSTLQVKPVDKAVSKYPDQFTVNILFTANTDTPAFFTDALKAKKVIFVEFYGEGDSLSDQMAGGIAELQQKYANKAIFLLLDADKPQTYGALSEQLPVQYIPQIFIFNNSATIIRSYTGYSDKDRLDQALYDAVNRGY
jgi:thiol-disulfide isomerase/thioredoxin